MSEPCEFMPLVLITIFYDIFSIDMYFLFPVIMITLFIIYKQECKQIIRSPYINRPTGIILSKLATYGCIGQEICN